MKLLLIDPKISGISGDMTISALVDLIGDDAPLRELENELNKIDGVYLKYNIVEDKSNGIRCKKLNLKINNYKFKEPEKLRDISINIGEKLGISNLGIDKINNIINDLIISEKNIHGDNFHLHEVSSIDTVFDVVGTILLIDRYNYLKYKIYGTPPVLGEGHIRIAHGYFAIPTPATLEIAKLHNIIVSNPPYPTNFEHTTPTGMSIFSNIVDNVIHSFPTMIPLKVGYGGGTKDLKDIPNVLRIVDGKNYGKDNNKDNKDNKKVILETNVDDVRGEIIGYLFERLLNEEGVRDVFIYTGIGKKNRPSHMVSVIVDYDKLYNVVKILMKETGTLGVRIKDFERIISEREMITDCININGKNYKFRAKISYLDEEILNIKVEYDDAVKISKESKLPLRKIIKTIECSLWEKYNGKIKK